MGMKVEGNLRKFSVIIPVYKTVKELPRCVDSVLAQEFKDFEIILVDDGSPDGSGKICDKYASTNEQINCIHQENQGVSVARNTGLKFAKGEYVLFLDSDDAWNDSKALTKLNSIIKEDPNTDVICFGYMLFDSNGQIRKTCVPYITKEAIEKYDVVKQLVYSYQYYNAAYLKVLKRDFLIKNRIEFKKGILSEDISWSGDVLLHAKNIKVYSSAFYNYILRSSGSITSSVGKKNVVDILSQIEDGIFQVEKESENEDIKQLYYEYWAYQFATVLGDIPRIKNEPDYEEIVDKCKEYTFLLDYHHVKKVYIVFLIYRVFGLNATMKVLYKYLNYKWR